MTEKEIKEGLKRLGPFAHDIQLPHGLTTHVPELSRRELERVRLRNLKALLWPPLLELWGGSLAGLRLLDAGCNCGGFSVEASASGADHVLGIDVVDRYIEQANFVKDALDLENVEFKTLSVEELDPEEVGHFDVTLCLGLLYHFENPVFSMRKLAAITDRAIVIDTDIDPTRPEEAYWLMQIIPRSFPQDPQERHITTGLWRKRRIVQFTPTTRSVEDLLQHLGFSKVDRLEVPSDPKQVEERYQIGERAVFLCQR